MDQGDFLALGFSRVFKGVSDDPLGSFPGHDGLTFSGDLFAIHLNKVFDARVKPLGVFSDGKEVYFLKRVSVPSKEMAGRTLA